jgi:hypothetical protein
MRKAYKIFVGKSEGGDHCEYLGVEWIKIKVKLSLCFIKHHAMKAYGGVEV